MRQKRSRRRKYSKTVSRVIGATVNGTVKLTVLCTMSAALLVYPNDARYTLAYFTDNVRSEPIIFELKCVIENINAMVDYQLELTDGQPNMLIVGTQGIERDEAGCIVARIEFPPGCGYQVEDIDVRSVKLHYDEYVADAIAGTATSEGDALIVEFDWATVERWLADLGSEESPRFMVTGEGERQDDGWKFTFSADNIVQIQQQELIEIAAIEVLGPGEIVIPLEESEVYRYDCVVLDTEGGRAEKEKVTWSVEGLGVSIDQQGILTVTNVAVPGTITIKAVLDSNEDIQGAMEVALAVPDEIPEEELIPEEIVPEEELIPPKDEDVEDGQTGEGDGEGEGDNEGDGDDGDSDTTPGAGDPDEDENEVGDDGSDGDDGDNDAGIDPGDGDDAGEDDDDSDDETDDNTAPDDDDGTGEDEDGPDEEDDSGPDDEGETDDDEENDSGDDNETGGDEDDGDTDEEGEEDDDDTGDDEDEVPGDDDATGEDGEDNGGEDQESDENIVDEEDDQQMKESNSIILNSQDQDSKNTPKMISDGTCGGEGISGK